MSTAIENDNQNDGKSGRSTIGGVLGYSPVLEITVGHWPFSDQFQHLADQNPFWSAKFPVHFQWGQQLVT